ncbi:hypothetical protein RhiirA4_448949 [Rhizophagus irregularis]|uniref:Uncharacterized protein n=1 Tax=Rhizophagus irregularis TaxID=588596 RepID=A0A2I1HEC6_9GLOM|nr:hypothetical protein RhiirA4_448949 [Rhizophagus irregularis]
MAVAEFFHMKHYIIIVRPFSCITFKRCIDEKQLIPDPIRTFKLESDKLSTQQIEGRNVIEDYFETYHFGNGKREKGRGERKGKIHVRIHLGTPNVFVNGKLVISSEFFSVDATILRGNILDEGSLEITAASKLGLQYKQEWLAERAELQREIDEE